MNVAYHSELKIAVIFLLTTIVLESDFLNATRYFFHAKRCSEIFIANNYSNFQESSTDTALLVRALDRFSRRLQAMNKLLPNTDFASAGNDIVLKINVTLHNGKEKVCLL